MNPMLGYAAIYFYRRDDFGTQILLQKKTAGGEVLMYGPHLGGALKIKKIPPLV